MNDKTTIAFQGLPLVFPLSLTMRALRHLEEGKCFSFLEEVLGYDQYLALESMDPPQEEILSLLESYVAEYLSFQRFKKLNDD